MFFWWRGEILRAVGSHLRMSFTAAAMMSSSSPRSRAMAARWPSSAPRTCRVALSRVECEFTTSSDSAAGQCVTLPVCYGRKEQACGCSGSGSGSGSGKKERVE